MCGLFFFFFSLISQTSSQQTAKDFCLKKYLRTQAVQLQHQLLALAWQQLMPVWRVEGKAAPTHWPQKKHKMATKKASRSCSSRIEYAEKQSSTGQPITPCLQKKMYCFPVCLPGMHFSHTPARRVCIAVVGCTSKLKYSQLFSETWCCSARQCHSWRRRFLHAAPAPHPGGERWTE